jgi:hypothetical protein
MDLLIEKTYSTPAVKFDPQNKVLWIEGRSIPENPADFYDPIVEWLKKYFREQKNKLEISIKLDYINSGSSKSILTLLKTLKTYTDNGAICNINWHYEEDDESLRDLGRHFKSILKLPFNLVEDSNIWFA